MNGRYLLDTNIVIALFAQEELIQEHLHQAVEICEQTRHLLLLK